MKRLLPVAFLLASVNLRAQTLTASSLVLTGSANSQMVGGAAANGDASCPVLSSLGTGQFATCYFSGTGAWELGYAGGSYSPIARVADLQTTQTTLQTSMNTLQQSMSSLGNTTTSLQSTVNVLQTSVTGVQLSTASLQTSVSTLQTSVSGMQTSLSSLQNQVNTSSNTQASQPSGPTTRLDVVTTGPLGLGRGFNTVTAADVIVDTASSFNRQTGIYTVPSAGTYLCVAKLRLADGVPGNISYGIGVGTTNADLPGFLWFSTMQAGWPRNGAGNTTVDYYTAGQQIRMYAYVDVDNQLPISYAELSIVKLGN